MTHVLGTYSIKGGVGKTTAAVNLAYHAAAGGARVLLWDLDPQGAATWLFRVKPGLKGGAKKLIGKRGSLGALAKQTDFPRLDLVPADFSHRHLDLLLDAKRKARRQFERRLRRLDDYDYVILDCPPGITLVSENVFEAADALLLPLIPTPLSLRTLEQLLLFLSREGWEDRLLLPFFTLVDRRKRLHREILEALPLRIQGLLENEIPNASQVEQMAVRRLPVAEFSPRSNAARAFLALWTEIEHRLWHPRRVQLRPGGATRIKGLGEMES